MSLNINGLRGKKLELHAFLASEEPDVVAIQETKIDKNIMSNEMIPDYLEYDVFRTDRNCNGGGTMLLVKKWLKPEPINYLNNGAESTWCYVIIHGTKHFFSSWYRPPSANTAYIKLLKDQIDIIKFKDKKHKQPAIHIYGDFNYPKINWETRLNKDSDQCLSDSDGQGLFDIINEASAEQLVDFSTRGDNLLDLIITTFPGLYISVDSLDRPSDHDVLRATLKRSHSRKKTPKRQYYQYPKGNYEAMRTDAKAFTNDTYFNGY